MIGLAACVQNIAGFGFALVAIALLPFFVSLPLATPLVLLAALFSSLTLVIRHRKSFDIKAIAPLVVSALVMIPLGLSAVNYLPKDAALRTLGGFIFLYVIYSMLRMRTTLLDVPTLSAPWAYILGGLSGFLTGAFTISGPPLVVYASSQAWSPEKFKGNIPAVFAMAQLSALVGHYFEGSLTPVFWRIALYSIPFFIIGINIGIRLSAQVDAKLFKQIVLALLGCIGLKWML